MTTDVRRSTGYAWAHRHTQAHRYRQTQTARADSKTDRKETDQSACDILWGPWIEMGCGAKLVKWGGSRVVHTYTTNPTSSCRGKKKEGAPSQALRAKQKQVTSKGKTHSDDNLREKRSPPA